MEIWHAKFASHANFAHQTCGQKSLTRLDYRPNSQEFGDELRTYVHNANGIVLVAFRTGFIIRLTSLHGINLELILIPVPAFEDIRCGSHD